MHAACCSIPAVIATGYTPKGSMTTLADQKIYSVGPADSPKVVICVYDIFGYTSQTQQGADRIAEATGFRVIMPDFLQGHGAPMDMMPPLSEAHKGLAALDEESRKKVQARLAAVFADAGDFQKRIPDLHALATALRAGGARRVGVYGLCWGGKLAALAAGTHNGDFDAVAQAHPTQFDADDYRAVTVPIASFPAESDNHDAQEKLIAMVEKRENRGLCSFHSYRNMHHGWAGARANLENADNLREFEDVYRRLSEFFVTAFAA
ncbi:hypothetical protein HDU86_002691 [Geranomyces michiganensis]|nr:hypothetical protein HDU86_002691 [Geranomyces michiganensis]